MKAEVVSVGTELLLGQTVDSNAAAAGRLLADLGIDHYRRQTVGDNLARLTETLRLALSRADIVFTIGGLGPTQDDLTREGVAAALNSPLIEDPALKRQIEILMKRRNRPMVASQYRQALRPDCADPLPNPDGTAPGLFATKDGKTIVCLPGPPNEFLPMLHGPVADRLRTLGDGTKLVSRTLRVVGIGEAALEEQLQDLLQHPQVTLAPYAKLGEVHLRLTARARTDQEGQTFIAPLADEIYSRIAENIYAEGDESLEAWIVRTLTERNQTLSVAESCTSGLLGAAFTSIDGSSQVFLGGLLTYAPSAKITLAHVSPQTIAEHGTVSAQTAVEMAQGAADALGSTYAVSITGVAGSSPLVEGGGEKPSGLVYIGLSTPTGPTVEKHHFQGNRHTIRQKAVAWAVADLRLALLNQTSE